MHTAGNAGREATFGYERHRPEQTLLYQIIEQHYPILFLDGVYTHDKGKTRFHRVKAPTTNELNALVHTISHRVAGLLERKGLLERDVENTWLTFDEPEENPLQQIHGHAIDNFE